MTTDAEIIPWKNGLILYRSLAQADTLALSKVFVSVW